MFPVSQDLAPASPPLQLIDEEDRTVSKIPDEIGASKNAHAKPRHKYAAAQMDRSIEAEGTACQFWW
jgi:hypothetical protein